jgi:uncharacterized protein YfaP (DUF2135 family)
MSKKFKIIVNTGNADNNQSVEVTQGQGGRGQPVRLQAKAGAKYQLLDLEKAKAVGPDYVKVKRVGKNLHILFEGSTEADVIIEDYYDVMPEGYNGVVGQAENGNFYEYIPEDPDVKGLIPQLADGGQAVSVALGGAEVVGSGAAIAVLAFNPLLAGLGLLGAGAAAAAAGAGGGGTTPVTGQKTALAIDPISADNIITVSEGNATNILVTGRVTGVFKEGDVVELVVNNKTYAASVRADGTFSVPVAMADLKADADTKIDGSINGTGGDRGTASQDYQVLTQGGPTTTALAIDPVTSDNVIGAAENTGNIAVTGKASGLFSAGDVVTLIVNGKTFTGVAAANGGFSINVPASDLVADVDTKLEGRVTGTGGTAADAFQDYALADNITPITSKTALRLNAVTADNVISASENTGSIAISGTVNGTFAAGDVVTLTVNGKNFTGAAAANGNFSINVPAADLVADSDTMIEARVTGTGGDTVNAVQDYSTTLDGNNSDKTALAIDPISGDNIITVTEGNASSLLVTGRVTGVFKEGDVVSLVLNNKNYAATVNADGTFSVPVSMRPPPRWTSPPSAPTAASVPPTSSPTTTTA